MSPIRSARVPGRDRGLIDADEYEALERAWDDLLEELDHIAHVFAAGRVLVEHVVDRAVQLRQDLIPGSIDDPLPDHLRGRELREDPEPGS